MGECLRQALLFSGAVIGAGFASGREVVSYFSAYGHWSWGLILLSAAVLAGLCCLCLHHARRVGEGSWCVLCAAGSPVLRPVAEGCILFLQVLMGGAMLSAAGHIAALVLPVGGAYLLGMSVTLLLAMWLGKAGAGPATLLGAALTICFVAAVVVLLVLDSGGQTLPLQQTVTLPAAAYGALRAVGYASLNLSLALGVICRSGRCSCRTSNRAAVLFGLVITALLFLCNYLYLKHPRLQGSAFPMVMLLSALGRAGFCISLVLMYLAVLTTLCAGLYTLRTGLAERFSQSTAAALAALMPLALSFAGFEALVERWYAPAGLACLVLVYAPLLHPAHTGGKNSA